MLGGSKDVKTSGCETVVFTLIGVLNGFDSVVVVVVLVLCFLANRQLLGDDGDGCWAPGRLRRLILGVH